MTGAVTPASVRERRARRPTRMAAAPSWNAFKYGPVREDHITAPRGQTCERGHPGPLAESGGEGGTTRHRVPRPPGRRLRRRSGAAARHPSNPAFSCIEGSNPDSSGARHAKGATRAPLLESGGEGGITRHCVPRPSGRRLRRRSGAAVRHPSNPAFSCIEGSNPDSSGARHAKGATRAPLLESGGEGGITRRCAPRPSGRRLRRRSGAAARHPSNPAFSCIEGSNPDSSGARHAKGATWTPLLESGGEGGIRTLDTGLPYTHFPGVRLRPLGHLSGLSREGTGLREARKGKPAAVG